VFFKSNKHFLIPYFVFLLLAGLVLLLYPKAEIHLYLNEFHAPFFDNFFKYATYIAEGFVVAVIIIALTWFKLRNGLLLLSSAVLASISAQFLKRVIFKEYVRPKAFFEGIANLRFVEGVEVHSSFSFPSGHSTSAFAVFFSLALLAKKPVWKMVFFFSALLVSWSRIYLSQHFLADIYFGSILGILCSILIFGVFSKKISEGNLLDHSVPTLIKNRRNSN
jgi:membrane-associated phospholipid phosphatase